MAAKILKFISHAEQIRLRGLRNYGRWLRTTKGLERLGPEERKRQHEEQARFEEWSRAWVQRHHPLPGGASVIPFPADALRSPFGTQDERQHSG